MIDFAPECLPDSIFQVLFEKSPGSVLLKADAPLFTILAVSDDFLKINTAKRNEVIGKGFFEAFPDNNNGLHGDTTAFKGFVRVIETREKLFIPFLRYDIWDHEINGLKPHYWRCSNVPILGPDNQVSYILKTIIDITGEVKANEATIESENRLLLAAEATGLAIWDFDIQQWKFNFSAQMTGLFGQPPETNIDIKLIISQVHPDDMENVVLKSYYESLTIGNFQYEVRIFWPDGSLRWVKAQGIVLMDEKNEPTRMLGTLMDITESKRDEIRKNDFIAMASHELKTPLTSLKAYLQLLEGKLAGSADPFVGTALLKAGNQVNKMTALIHSFLDISKLEPGKLQLKRLAFDINKLLEETIAESRLLVNSHIIHFEPSCVLNINADKEKISQVIGNFLSNATKYSPKGSIIRVRSEIIDGNIQVSVNDKGIGIRPKDHEKIFQRFYRAEDEELKNVSGFGIGLYLSSEIIQRHKGKIWVKSEEGKGATFYFSLPLSA